MILPVSSVILGSIVVTYIVVVVAASQRTSAVRPKEPLHCCFHSRSRICASPFRGIRFLSIICAFVGRLVKWCPSAASRYHEKRADVAARLRQNFRWVALRIGLPLLVTLLGTGLAVFALTLVH
ncbi:hypothetical protein KAX17_01250 [Candidatus Bipolaricaulota bacterium]|nr:hypothetical protein [Candidatus Bipolaricaulota bacterium]